MKRFLALSLLLLALSCGLSGCATGSGSKWYSPGSWFSHAPADKADKATARVTLASEAVILEAQKAVHETQFALLAAGDTRPVAVATNSNDTAVALLDQAAGPLTVADLAATRALVANLLSENADIRAKAEKERAESQKTVATISTELEKAVQGSRTANDALRTAYDRENALANQLRSQKALLWIAGSLTVLFAAGWLYVRFFLGGIPGAIGSALSSIERKSPKLADELRTHLDATLNRHEQATIASAYRKTQ